MRLRRRRLEWRSTTLDNGDVHTVPTNDDVSHDLNEDCVCGPTPELRPVDGDDRWVYGHHALSADA